MNVQEVLLSRGNEFEYALVSVGDATEVVYFTRYELDGEVFYLESPCYLEEIHQFEENNDIEKECITLVEDMLDDDVDRHQFFAEHMKPCIVDNTLFEILTPQTAPYLPKEVDNILFLSEEECVLYLLRCQKNKSLMALIKKLERIPNAYFGFVAGISTYAKKKPERLIKVMDYIKNNPHASTSDIIKFVAAQPDFYEDNIASLEEREES